VPKFLIAVFLKVHSTSSRLQIARDHASVHVAFDKFD